MLTLKQHKREKRIKEIERYLAGQRALHNCHTEEYERLETELLWLKNPKGNAEVYRRGGVREYLNARRAGCNKQYISEVRRTGLAWCLWAKKRMRAII